MTPSAAGRGSSRARTSLNNQQITEIFKFRTDFIRGMRRNIARTFTQTFINETVLLGYSLSESRNREDQRTRGSDGQQADDSA